MSYANRKFGHSHVTWVIEGCCLWYQPLRKKIESPFFYVDGEVQTKWRMAIKCYPNEDHMWFQLTRLKHGDDRPVWAHFKISHWDFPQDSLVLDRQKLFQPGETIEEECRTWDVQIKSIDVKLKLIVFPHDMETVPECEDAYLRRLSLTMKIVYDYRMFNPASLVKFETGPNSEIYADKTILMARLKNREARDLVFLPDPHLSEDFTFDDFDKVIGFLYTADMAPAARYPQVGTYDLAERLQVQPLMTYYQPDKLCLYSTTKLHVFKIEWTIAGLATRTEPCLISPRISGELYHSVIKIFPDVTKTNRGNIGVNFEIYLAARRHVCMELSLKTETYTEKLLEEFHKTFIGQEIFGSGNMILAETLSIIPAHGRATVELTVSLSESPEESSVNKSMTIRKPYCHQQNYMQLSRDMLSLYTVLEFCKTDTTYVMMWTTLLNCFRFFLETRNTAFVIHFLDRFIRNGVMLNRVRFETLDQVVQFLFSGKFSEELFYRDVFYFYRVAKRCDFESLKNALVDELRKVVSGQNVNDIFQFALELKIYELIHYINERFEITFQPRHM